MSNTDKNEEQINLKLIIVISRLIKAIGLKFNPEFKSIGLSPTQFIALEALYHKGPLTVNQIIERADSSSGNIGVVIDNLVKNGMVRKRKCDKDRRIRYIEITEKGSKLIRDFFPGHVKNINQAFSSLEAEEKKDLIFLIKKLGKGISENN